MRSVALVVLGLAVLLSGCGGGGGNGGTDTPTYTVSVLQTDKTQPIAEAWFVDNSGRVFGIEYPDNGTGSMCVWQPDGGTPALLHIPDEVSYCIIQRMTIGGYYQHISNKDRIAYIGETSTGIADLLTGETVTLTSPPGSSYAVPSDVNDDGVCVGTCYPDRGQGDPALPVVWSALGEPTQLTLPPGCSAGQASAINSLGQIAGTASSADYPYLGHAVVWNADGSVAREIPRTPEQVQDGVGVRGLMISDNGYLVVRAGWSFDLVSPTGVVTHVAYPMLGQGISAMNSHGQIAGYDSDGPLVWNPDGSKIRLPLPFAGALCVPWDINDDGVVVGVADSQISPGRIAVKWTPSH